MRKYSSQPWWARGKTWQEEEEEEEEEEEDQRELRLHQRYCHTPSRPTSPLIGPYKYVFLFTTGRAPLKHRRPMGLAFMIDFRSAKEPPYISVNITKTVSVPE